MGMCTLERIGYESTNVGMCTLERTGYESTKRACVH